MHVARGPTGVKLADPQIHGVAVKARAESFGEVVLIYSGALAGCFGHLGDTVTTSSEGGAAGYGCICIGEDDGAPGAQ